jgi:hypothetical protein
VFGRKRIQELEAELSIAHNALSTLTRKHAALIKKWNALIIEHNNGNWVRPSRQHSTQFSQDDIRRLIQLCHPDKHDSSKTAVEMTQKLLAMRN